jgi:hypothetical protein
LELNIHYKVDEKNKNVVLTEQGSQQIERILELAADGTLNFNLSPFSKKNSLSLSLSLFFFGPQQPSIPKQFVPPWIVYSSVT